MNLKDLRIQCGITQKKLADTVGVTQAYICALETGKKRNPSADVLYSIAQAMDVSVDELLRELRKAG